MITVLPTGPHLSIYGGIYPFSPTLIATFGWAGFDVANLIYIPDHVALAKSRLIEEFKPRPRINSLVEIQAERIQGLEDVGMELLRYRDVDSSYGVQLDLLGEMVGEPRNGKGDEEYRLAIETRTLVNRSSGTGDDIIRFIRAVTDTPYVDIMEPAPAFVSVNIGADTVPQFFNQDILKIKAGGVGISVVNDYGETPFVFDYDGLTIERGKGFDEGGYTESGSNVGGRITELIT